MKIISSLLALFIVLTLFGQKENPNTLLPRGLSDAESGYMESYFSNYQFGQRGIESPPGGNLRCAAEWEEVQTVVITWTCLLYTSPSPRDVEESRMPSSA